MSAFADAEAASAADRRAHKHKHKHRDGGAGGGGHGGGRSAEMSTMNPVAALGSISEDIGRLNGMVGELRRMMSKLGGPEDRRSFRATLKKHREASQKLTRDINLAIGGVKVPSGDGRMRASKAKVVRDFRTVLQDFEATNKECLLKERQNIAKMEESLRTGGGLDEAVRRDSIMSDAGMGGETSLEFAEVAEVDIAIVNERAQEAEGLARDAADLHEMFVDLGHLVEEQGEQINTIEGNVDKAHGAVEAGVSDLQDAVEYQKRYRKKMCCLLIIMLIIVGGFVLAGVTIFGGGGSSNSGSGTGS